MIRAMVPQPPLWSYLLLEQPWPLILGLIGAWAVLRVLGSRRHSLRLRLAAVGMLALAAGVALLAWAVTTDREALLTRTEALVSATDPIDQALLDGTIAGSAEIAIADGPTIARYGRSREAWDQVTVARQTIRDLGAGLTQGGEGVSEVSLLTMLEQPPMTRPIPSRWRLHWRRTDTGDWQVRRIVLVSWQGQPANQAGEEAMQQWLGQ
jgi:hypothetical protein